ncbi:MAG: response regulator [Gammaproteobacteria bacterium]|nr:response regulator [Gammaproteobacteria bacterium]
MSNIVTSVLLVDDHDLVREGLRQLFNHVPDIEIVGEANTGEQAVQFVRKTRVDVVLMDLNLPRMSGLEATRRILTARPGIKILALSAYEDEIRSARILHNGALGYITKEGSPDELIKAIRQVATGKRYISERIAKRLAVSRFSANEPSLFEQLSDREIEVMLMIVRGKGSAEIARELHLSPKTVNCYRYRLLKQLNVTNEVELTYLAARCGLIDLPVKGKQPEEQAGQNGE